MKLPSSRYYAWWLAALRIFSGLAWLSHGVAKFLESGRYLPPNGFIPRVVAAGVQNSSGWYHGFLLQVVTPNIGVFAELVRVGEVLVGCSLVVGLWSRLGGLGGCFLALNYGLADGSFAHLSAIGMPDATFFALSFINVVVPTGRVLSIDALFAPTTKPAALIPEIVDEPAPVPPAAHEGSLGAGPSDVV